MSREETLMRKGLISSLIAFIVFLSLISPVLASDFSQDANAIEKAASSVLKLYIYNDEGKEIATGSGFVAIDNQTIITNYHVIEDGKKITAVSDAGQQFEVSILYCADKEYDVAILGFDIPSDINPLPLGNSNDLKRGEKVVAIGSPIGIRNTVSTGNISAIYEESGIPWIQFTAPISKGSSGGPLLDDSGTVIGITSAFFVDGQNLNLAIDISIAKAMYNGWSGKTNHIGDNITKATFDFSANDTDQDEFADWNLFKTNGMDISIPNHYKAYSLDELRHDYSVLNNYRSEAEWVEYFKDEENIPLYFVDQSEAGYDIEICIEESDLPDNHIFSIDEMKRIIEGYTLDEDTEKYSVLDHSQTLFWAIKRVSEHNIYIWTIRTVENSISYTLRFSSLGKDFTKNQEEEILQIIKSINLKNAKFPKKRNYISKFDGDVHNIPSTGYDLSETKMHIFFPNSFAVFYKGLDSSYLFYRGQNDLKEEIENLLSEGKYSLIALSKEIYIDIQEPQYTSETDLLNLKYNELIDYANYQAEDTDSVDCGRIIANLQTPFLRTVFNNDYNSGVTYYYYTVFSGKQYWIRCESELPFNEESASLLDKIILSIQFY